MALSTPRIIGRQLTVTVAGTKTIWDKLTGEFKYNTADATASDSTLEEGVFTTKKFIGQLSGFLGQANNGTTLPAIGDTISDWSAAVGADSVMPSVAAYTNIKVTNVKYDLEAGPGKFVLDVESGMLN